eukprot:4190929-Alexandrium_andersonii.AAC.1
MFNPPPLPADVKAEGARPVVEVADKAAAGKACNRRRRVQAQLRQAILCGAEMRRRSEGQLPPPAAFAELARLEE